MIRITNLSHSYGSLKVLDDFNLEVKSGSVQSLIGPNGVGKTTLIHILAGLIRPVKGRVILGADIGTPSYSKEVLRRCGFVFEQPIYIEKFSAREYLLFHSRLYGLDRGRALKRISYLMEMFELPADNRKYIEDYSKGMKAKVSLSAALLHEPEFLILDEPFDGMDILSINSVIRILKSFAEQGATILFASHSFELVKELSDFIGVLREGKLALNLSKEEFQRRSRSFDTDFAFIESIFTAK